MAAASALAQPPKQPNILFMFTDDQRFDTVRALGASAVRTPNMDRLVRRGVSFTRAFIMGGTIGAVCAPSRAMMLTGQSLFHVHDSIVQPKPDPRPFHMWPELLRGAGYRTHGTGKWHNGPKLFNRCFESGGNIFFGGMSDHRKVPVNDYDPSGEYPKEKIRTGEKFSSELFADEAIRFLQSHKGDRPFALYAAFTAPHDPRMAPTQFTDLYPVEKVHLPDNFLPEHPFDNGELRIRDEMLAPFPRTPEIVKQHIAAYYAMITEVDEQIGRVLDALDRSRFADNTVVVFAADNGLAVGQHGLLGKQNLYDHSVRVPLVVGGPGIDSNKRCDAMVYLSDICPTLLELCGVAPQPTVESRSLAPALRGRGIDERDSIFLAYRNLQRGVRTGDFKLIGYQVNGMRTTQLFDMRRDPLERNNLAKDPKHASDVKRLQARLARWMEEIHDPLTPA